MVALKVLKHETLKTYQRIIIKPPVYV